MRIFGAEVTSLDRLHWIITFLIRISLLVAAFSSFMNDRWQVLFVTLLTLFFTFIPRFIKQQTPVRLPIEFELLIIVFVYATLFLGDVHGYYTRFWWWDIVMHTGSGIAMGFIGFLLVYVLYRGSKLSAGPVLVAVLAFSFALAIGALWEIIEFSIDSLIGTNMQKSGLVDTMWDLIVDAAGGLLASSVGYLYVKGKNAPIFERLLESFVNENPGLFKR